MEETDDRDHLNAVIRKNFKIWRHKYWKLAGENMMVCVFAISHPESPRRGVSLRELFEKIGEVCPSHEHSSALEIVANAAIKTFFLLEADRLAGKNSLEKDGLEAVDLFRCIGIALEQEFFSEPLPQDLQAAKHAKN